MWKQFAPYVVPLLVLALILRRAGRERTVKLGRLWVYPAILTLAAIATLASANVPSLLGLLGFAAALALGGGVGFLRSYHMQLSVNQETGNVTSKATPLGTILIAALFALRIGLKLMFPEMNAADYGPSAPSAHAIHPNAAVLFWTDASLLFAVGMIWGRALTTYFRAKPLLDAHHAAKAGAAK